ncbi:MAG: hypothetical protein H0X72_04545 [Acidobacteria bacterium]|nr:hypothetical protein [Acidobacteriota bacterium]
MNIITQIGKSESQMLFRSRDGARTDKHTVGIDNGLMTMARTQVQTNENRLLH